ncbi:MAG: ribonuclease HII [Gemmatimonadetes bacterium]|nr:ribonuclease HII [Gemmatimonadota bacterium]
MARGRRATRAAGRRLAARRRAERRRLARLLALEKELWGRGLRLVAGVDETGRGPLAGPVLAAAVILPPGLAIPGVDDSKRLLAPLRVRLDGEIRQRALGIGIGAASAREIDRLNILRASHLAMQRALRRLPVRPQHVIVDGPPIPGLEWEHTAVIDGDRRVHSVACASIVAKVLRDHLMHLLSARYPDYGWEHNAGYATADHRAALARLGPTPHHRRSFGSAQLVLQL